MRKAIVALPVTASVLIVAIVVILLWMAGSASGDRARFSSLEIAPEQADIFLAINTDPTSPQWLAVNGSLDAINAKDPIRRAIDEALAEVNLDWEEDILPVAGDEAFFSVPDISKAGDEGGFVAGFRIRDTSKAGEVFDELRARAEEDGEEFTEEEYEGVTIYYTEGGDSLVGSDAGAVALFEDVLAVGASPDDVQGVIDVVQGRSPSAEGNERLQEFREAQKEDFLTWGYADLGNMWDTLEEGLATGLGSDGGFGGFESDAPPMVTPAPIPAPETDFRIPSFDADYRVEDGALHVTERITVDFGDTPKHGIFRDISTRVTYDFLYDADVTIEFVSVTRDGAPEQFEETAVGGDYHQVKIGDPDATISGQHTYEIQYLATGAVIPTEVTDPEPFEPESFYEIVWNVTGDGWGVPIEAASATVTIPDTFLSANCTVEPDPIPVAGFNRCLDTQEGLQTIRFESDGPVEPGSGLAFYVKGAGRISAPPPALVPNDLFPDISEQPEEPTFPIDFNSEELIDELRGTYDRVGFSVSATGDRFALDLTVLHAPGFDPKYPTEPTQVFDSHFAGSVPADTMFFFAGYDIYGQAKGLSDYLDKFGPPGSQEGDDFLGDFEDTTGLDLVEDVLSLLTGEYAVAGNVSDFEDEPPDFTVLGLMDVNDAVKAQDSLDAVGEFLEDEGVVSIEDSGDIQRWEFLEDAEIEGVGVTIDGNALIAGYPEGAVQDYVDGFDNSLADTEDWKRTLGLLPQDTTSIGFISLARIFEELRETEAEESFNESTNGELTLEDLGAIRSVAFATTFRDNGFGMHLVLFMEDR